LEVLANAEKADVLVAFARLQQRRAHFSNHRTKLEACNVILKNGGGGNTTIDRGII
jgi:hypothetical protein